MDLGLQLWPALDEWAEDRCEQAGAEIRRGGDAQDPSGFARELGEPRDDAPDPVQQVRWPAPGAPELIPRVQELLAAQRIRLNVDAQRGFDHGTFVPGAVMWPEPTVPVLQMSLVRGLDPERHLAIGRALAPLRDEGVLILASGMSYHDMRGFFSVMRGRGGRRWPWPTGSRSGSLRPSATTPARSIWRTGMPHLRAGLRIRARNTCSR